MGYPGIYRLCVWGLSRINEPELEADHLFHLFVMLRVRGFYLHDLHSHLEFDANAVTLYVFFTFEVSHP
jgi:hypothetical protein